MNTVITGASSGIGAVAALDLAKRGHRLVLVGRDPARLAGVADRVGSIAGTPADVLVADFASLDQVRRLARELLDRCQRIDVLINNAGMMVGERRITEDDNELIIQVNHLAPFLLTNLLIDRLRACGARVVTTSSRAARAGRLDPGDLSRERRRWNGWLQYGDSKQANALFTVSLAERGLAATCLHPGVLKTGFAADTRYMRLVTRMPGMSEPVAAGAGRIVHLATHEDGVAHPGRYFARNLPVGVPSRMSDPALAEALWRASLTATGLGPSAADS
ncbi:SDR family NAD(P)-dependent oxidoreductase [Sphaerimonospora thailandensis]|uniref:SDR family NAD(P)-dependent oxidoreductase n=1 Tax=Sphaerimonospora thailandensis TaxID=795644 RepID=UPI00195077C6|nr:SDR family NAD(P)-dependent oxidoreductase [Sphaerimonospora thailandensis]